jgi:uncharacterized protein (DUF1800 family)
LSRSRSVIGRLLIDGGACPVSLGTGRPQSTKALGNPNCALTDLEQLPRIVWGMPSEWEQAARLARRTGFGATGADVDAVVRMGPNHYASALLAADPTTDPGAKATPPPHFAPIARLGKQPSKTAKMQRNKQRGEQLRSLTAWWLRRMVAVEQPFGEKLTFCWHNHFATSAKKVKDASAMLGQNATLRTLGRGDFRRLAYAMLVDPAMLRWLDGQKNTATAPNENLAREFMELFTLGHGDAYTETDVREGARALTGWRFSHDGTAALRAKLHDDKPKTVLGVSGNLDAAGFCDAVLAQPGAPSYLATRMWGQLASDTTPSAAVVDRLVSAYGPKRDIGALLTALLTAPEFAAAQNSIVVTPVEWLVGVVRSLRVPIKTDADAVKLTRVLRGLGQVPFFPPSVAGWPSGQAWLSTAAVNVRMQAALSLTRAGDLSALDGTAPSRVDAVGHLLGVGSWSARSAAVLRAAASDPERLVAVAVNTPEYLTN